MGAMKSLAYDYAIFLASPDKNYDVINDLFSDIVNGVIEIPQDYVTEWVNNNSVFASESVVFDAETKSWKQQKRDAKGRFSKTVTPSVDSQYQEMIEPYYKYVDLDTDMDLTPELFSAFIEAAISDEEFPEKLTDPYFYQYLQKIAEAVHMPLLEQLNELLKMQNEMGRVSGDRNTEILGGRGIFVTDILLNIKVGQESWAAEDDTETYTEAEINLMRYDLVEHELENADYNYLYEIMLYGTTGLANLSSEDVIKQFRTIFERS